MFPYSLTLSKKFQSGELNFSRIKPVIKKNNSEKKGSYWKQKTVTERKHDFASRHNLHEKELSTENEQQLKLYREKYIESMIGDIHACFPEDMLSVLGSFSIFSVENFPSSSDSEEV